jgi:hypothetical protein
MNTMKCIEKCAPFVLLIVSLAACNKHPSTVPDAALPTYDKPVAAATPPPAPHLAPDGVFYLVSSYHVETKDGVIGLPPGTGVKRVRKGEYLTPAGIFAIRDDLLTNDMDEAREARDADRAKQASLASSITAPPPAPVAAPPRPIAAAPSAATPTVAAQREELVKQRALINVQIDRLYAERRTLTNRSARKSPDAERIMNEVADLREQIRQIDEKLIELR